MIKSIGRHFVFLSPVKFNVHVMCNLFLSISPFFYQEISLIYLERHRQHHNKDRLCPLVVDAVETRFQTAELERNTRQSNE